MRFMICLLFALVAGADDASGQPFCETSADRSAQLRQMHDFLSARASTTRRFAASDVTVRDNVILIPNDDTIAPLNRNFNLTGRSVTFTRNGEGAFSSKTGELIYEEERGAQLTLDLATRSAAYDIQGFDFPFFETTHRRLYISRYFAIYLMPAPAPATFRQHSDAELLLLNTPVIAPYLTTTLGQTAFRPPALFVKEHEDRLVVTWAESNRPIAVQAVLFRSGEIRFSYRSIGGTRGGAIFISSGSEPWRTPVTISSASDPANDFTHSNPPEIGAMMDITNVTFRRIGKTNVVQLVIKVREPIDRARLGAGNSLGLNVRFAPSAILNARISGAGVSSDNLTGSLFSINGPTPLMRVEGATITITFAQENVLLHSPSDEVIQVGIATQFGGDTVEVRGRIELPPRERLVFATSPQIDSFDGPILQSFTLPFSNVFTVWQRLQERFALDPTQIDGVAVYQNFSTIGNAVSSVGNPAVDNISIGPTISTTLPREPNLMDMHTIRELWNGRDDQAMHVLLHEWGHRWLFFIEHLESGVATRVLQSIGHPALYVDTRAAFSVLNSYDCSVMGGSTYTDNGDGTFTGPPDTCSAGYSWLELYLMGLAPPQEVPTLFYLSDTDPPIDQVDFVETQTFRGTRKNVRISDVTNRMGVRKPVYPDTQRAFKVLFVLVYDPNKPLLPEDIAYVARYADLFRSRFATATGNRASVETSFETPPRRRAVRRE